jgi:endonuclease/exonuclease/phosphatase family metal-dependent hydrolase
MFAQIESTLRRWRRRLSRSEWAIRHLGLAPAEGQSEEPGLLLIQIDGLARRQLETAIAKGRMPFLRRLRDRGHYALHTFYPGIPTTTPAVQAELYYGVRAGVPAFSFLDRETGETGMMFQPAWAKKFEGRFQADNEGLLKGGSSWSNIYSGGAAPEETHFCGASIAFADMWRTGKIRNIFVFIVLHFFSALKIAGLLLLELAISVPQAVRGILRGQWPSQEFGMVISRTFIGIGLRELITIGGKIDVTRGLPVVHVNFLGYDELSHRRGPGSRFAHWSLKGIDRSIKHLYRAALRSRRRDYHVWIFSDHGQERTRSFATDFPGGIQKTVTDALAAEGFDTAVTLAALGPVGHAYFTQKLTDPQRHALARRLVDHGKVPGVLFRARSGRIAWLHADGESVVPDEIPALLAKHPEPLRAEIAKDLVTFCENPNSGDLILLGWGAAGAWTFAPERGAHAGTGTDETQGFLFVPAGTRLPADSADFIRPSGLRDAGLALLGRQPLAAGRHSGARTGTHLRVMTYNTHSCGGMDGRVSPRRIARIISQQSPDIVALQEVDHGRSRSRGEDQATLIAHSLGYHVVFCRTVSHGDKDHYGHALLSRHPIETVKVAPLPQIAGGWWPESRGALWARIEIDGTLVNVVTTHLGLNPRERLVQMEALLGPDWLGPVIATEPVVLCGDFNLSPGSPPYRLAMKKLRDVQSRRAGHRPLATFSSARPLLQLDHIFVSAHFETDRAFVPRDDLTRLASDHLPLLADLSFSSADAGTTTRTSARSRPSKRQTTPSSPA